MSELITIAVILLFGTLVSFLANKLKVSNVFFLIFIGMLFALFGFEGFPQETIITIGELALIFVVFDATAKLNMKEVMKFSKPSLKLSLIFFLFVFVFIGSLTLLFFSLHPLPLISVLLALLFSTLIYGIDPAIALSVLQDKKQKVVEILEIETILNTPLTVVVAFVLIDLLQHGIGLGNLSDQGIMFLRQLFIPIGVGVVLGYGIVSLLRHSHSVQLSHLTMITSAVLSYVLAETMGGNGVLAVTTFGLIFGNHTIKHKIELERFASIFTNTLTILVFVLLGMVIVQYSQYRSIEELSKGTLLFFLYLLVRFCAVWVSFRKTIPLKQQLFMTLNVPKGLDVAVVLFFLLSAFTSLQGMQIVVNIVILFILYSIVLATVASVFTPWFFSTETKQSVMSVKRKIRPTKKRKKTKAKKTKRTMTKKRRNVS